MYVGISKDPHVVLEEQDGDMIAQVKAILGAYADFEKKNQY